MSNVSAAAQNALKKFGKDAEPTLLLALTDKNPRAAWKAAMLLAIIGNNAGADHLLNAVAKGSPGERMEGLKFLAQLGDARALLPLIDALVDREPDVVKKAPTALDQLLRIKPDLCEEVLKVLREKQAPCTSPGSWGFSPT